MLDQVSAKLERYMDLLGARQKLVASNLANADTPDYKTKDLSFQAEFQSAVRDAAPRAIEVPGLKTKNDGNNVSVDREARLLAENALRFNIASQLVRAEIRALRNAIQEGKSA
ncbi:MAG: flagellar basal body protein [Acidobacteriota bacterium]|nr:flagellar basal body protein [Acidobacteriota bacterium]